MKQQIESLVYYGYILFFFIYGGIIFFAGNALVAGISIFAGIYYFGLGIIPINWKEANK
jgi:5-bromo-4-chloroindolyl phosphate hydrolysis protein